MIQLLSFLLGNEVYDVGDASGVLFALVYDEVDNGKSKIGASFSCLSSI